MSIHINPLMLLTIALSFTYSVMGYAEDKFSLKEHKLGTVNKIEREISASNTEPWDYFDLKLKDIYKQNEGLWNLEPLQARGPEESGSKSLILGEESLRLERAENGADEYQYVGIEVNSNLYTVSHGKKTIYKVKLINEPFAGVIQSFYVHKGHWILEYKKANIKNNKVINYSGTVVVDGININEKYGMHDIFNYIFINNQPLFFYRNNIGKIMVSYNGKDIAVPYDDVKHYLCCSDSFYNPRWNNYIIAFWSVKGKDLYYCEGGLFK